MSKMSGIQLRVYILQKTSNRKVEWRDCISGLKSFPSSNASIYFCIFRLHAMQISGLISRFWWKKVE